MIIIEYVSSQSRDCYTIVISREALLSICDAFEEAKQILQYKVYDIPIRVAPHYFGYSNTHFKKWVQDFSEDVFKRK